MKREWIERRILVPALVVYVVLLVLASWRHEIRPAVFDRVSDLARDTLAVAGIPPAVAVFSADTASAPDAKIAAICLEVRGISEERSQTRVYPPEGVVCPAPSPRLWVRGEEIFLHRSLVGLRAAAAARQGGDDDPRRTRFASLLASSIRAHFLGRERNTDQRSDRSLLLWRESRISYETHIRSDRVVALFEWQSLSDPRVFIRWQPDEARLRERGWTSNDP
jgi:hypothetical protein